MTDPQKNPMSVFSLTFSLDAKRLASGHRSGVIVLWDLQSRQVLRNFEGHKRGVTSLAFSPDGYYLASGSDDGTAKVWDAETGRERFSLQACVGASPGGPRDTCVAFSPDGKILATGSLNVKLWDLRALKEIQILPEWDGLVNALKFSPDGATLAVGAENSGHLILYRIPEGITRRRLDAIRKIGAGLVYEFAFSADLKTFAWAFNWRGGNWVKLWSTESEQELCTFAATHVHGAITQVTFSADGRHVASSDIAGNIRCWNVATRRETFVIHRPERVYAVEFSPDGKTLAYAGEETAIRLEAVDSRTAKPDGVAAVAELHILPIAPKVAISEFESLVHTLEDRRGDWFKRQQAVEKLGKMTDFRVMEQLVTVLLEDPEGPVRSVAKSYLDERYPDWRASEPVRSRVPGFIGQLEDPSKETRMAAASALSNVKALEAVPALAAMLNDRDYKCRKAAESALSVFGGKEAEEALTAYRTHWAEASQRCPRCGKSTKAETIHIPVKGKVCSSCGWSGVWCFECGLGPMKATEEKWADPQMPVQAFLKCEVCGWSERADYIIIRWLQAHGLL